MSNTQQNFAAQVAFNNNSFYNPEEDKALSVIFEKKVFINEKKSLETGVPVTIEKDYVTITRVNTVLIKRAVIQNHKTNDPLRFPNQWEAYQKGQEQTGIFDGIPIEKLPGIKQEQVAICKHLKLYSISQVGGMIDTDIRKLGLHGRNLVEACKRYITGRSDLDDKIDDQAKIIEELKAQIAEITPKRRRSRKKPEVIEEVVKDESINDSPESGETV